jgi:type II secretory pathway component GspD/PulD (secretin)
MRTGPWNARALIAWVLAAAVCAAQEPPPANPGPAADSSPGQGSQSSQSSQTAPPTATAAAQGGNATAGPEQPPREIREARQPTGSERRRAASLYLSAAKDYQKGEFEAALRQEEQAASLDPTNGDYRLAADIARSHAVTALIQTAARDRIAGDAAGAHAALAHALELDPHNSQVAEHLGDPAGGAPPVEVNPDNQRATESLGELEQVEPRPGVQSFHLKESQRQIIQKVFKAYGIDATMDESIRGTAVRFDADDANFAEATRALSLVTRSFFVPIDPHRVLVAFDTRQNRIEFTRNGEETVYLAGLNATEMTDMGNLAKNVFEVNQSAVNPTAGTLTLRAPASQLNAFNATFNSLMDGRNQVLLDVKLIQLSHINGRNTGVTLPQQVTAFNIYAEEQSILNANSALVQQIISSGLAAPGDTLAILGILLASGAVSSSLFQNGIVVFGGGLTATGLTASPLTVNLNVNSSDSRELDQFQMHLGDGEEGTLKSGTRYPIMTSSYSNLGGIGQNIPGLNTAGTTANLGGLLSSLTGANGTIPQIQYEDLGLTLKATPSVMRSGEVTLKIDMKITALAGSSVNGVPVLANRAWSGVVTVGQNQAVVVASEMDKQESSAVSGTPGLSEVPGLNNITSKDVQKNYSTLVIMLTPHVVRSPRHSDHSPMLHVDPNYQTR